MGRYRYYHKLSSTPTSPSACCFNGLQPQGITIQCSSERNPNIITVLAVCARIQRHVRRSRNVFRTSCLHITRFSYPVLDVINMRIRRLHFSEILIHLRFSLFHPSLLHLSLQPTSYMFQHHGHPYTISIPSLMTTLASPSHS